MSSRLCQKHFIVSLHFFPCNERMKSVLYISPSSGIGGVETFLSQLNSNSDESRFRNIFLLFDEGPLLEVLKNQQAKVEVLSRKPRLSKPRDWLFVTQEICRLIEKYDIRLVHSSQSYAALFAAFACKIKKRPHVWFQHGPTSGWMDQLAAVLYHQGILSNSNFTAEQQQRLEENVRALTPKNRKNQTLHLGTSVSNNPMPDNKEKRSKLLSQHGLPEETKIVSMLCRIQHWKGVHLAVEAFEKLKESSEKVHLFIWGEAFKGEEYYQSLLEKCQKSQLPVHFLGKTKNPQEALAVSDLLLNASVEPEPFGLTIIEAMSVGTPPLAPNEGGPKEIIKEGINGLLFEPRNASSLAEKIRAFAQNQELQNKLSKGALDSVKKDFRIEQTVDKLEQYHLSIIST